VTAPPVTVDHLLTVPCSLVTRSYDETPDAQGEQLVVETIVGGFKCEVQTAGSREEQGGSVRVTSYRVFLGAGTPLVGWDAIRRDDTGEVLELDGDVVEARSPMTGVAYVEANATKVDEGA
jgi:hypothetical protein